MSRILRLVRVISAVFVVSSFALPAQAGQTAGEAMEHMAEKQGEEAAFAKWVSDFKQEAVSKHGFSKTFIDKAFAEIRFKKRVIELDRAQPHSKMTFDKYRQLIVPESRVKLAQKKYRENKKLLNEVGKRYGVQPRFIVALWAIESNFGQNMGGFSIVESLSTLAFEGRRAEFFKKELIHALNIIKNGDVSIEDMKGSWAGAMGQTQFMPSSYAELAVDYDGDGKRDIWNTKADAFASIANYLSKRGWDDETTWGREVSVPKNFDAQLYGRNVEKSIQSWHNLGVKKANGRSLPLSRGELKASIVRPAEDQPPYYMVYNNYNVIMNWNRSLYFATAVGLLSDAIGNM